MVFLYKCALINQDLFEVPSESDVKETYNGFVLEVQSHQQMYKEYGEDEE